MKLRQPDKAKGEINVIIAWEGQQPVYATRRLLKWREEAQRLRESYEATNDQIDKAAS